ncbi:hypothetical protein GCM10011505_20370 [Tistrella bauzanensis]|uniref:Uncharacterized protein n=1 Tax=Tistrella bauzanensis TaxID=657419 RepID=A0ABQ1IJ70_9PROT|nr:hypothetical protein [Tistrella bauzanensis]GGB38721.1 hypothetical protein GCM10011505_20370 [Tistrella bauzanensis]
MSNRDGSAGRIGLGSHRRGRVVTAGGAMTGRSGVVRGAALRGGAVPGEPVAPAAADHTTRATGGLELALMIAVLPMFGQVFHYLIDVGPLYYLSKAWPFLTLPLAMHGAFRLSGRHHPLYAMVLGYVIGITPALSMIWLGNAFLDAFGTTVKVWPLTYYFSVLSLLVILRPHPDTLRRVLLAYGVVTFAMMWALWLLVPRTHYAVDPTQSKLFMYEVERGYRIYMPMVFGIMSLLYLVRRMTMSPRLIHVVLYLAGLATMVMIFKQRTSIMMLIVISGWVLYRNLPKLAGSVATVVLGVGLVAATVLVVLPAMDLVAAKFGNSLSIRMNSLTLAFDYMLADAWRWLFGVGSITRFSAVTLFDLFGTNHFYLADIGWVGIVFEYGVVGALLLLALYAVGLQNAYGRRARAPERRMRDPRTEAMVLALGDYVLFLLVISSVYSAVFTPGELAMVTALLIYVRGFWSTQAAMGPHAGGG